uniref:Zinc finger protein 729-like n=1 Tax=Saccoglossus kowalevskii TaxID=10224 RepID=A0ABM0LYF2_SACKO|nr:PREDICTED: zinc finger protein 729-like [Saccoglossus kowalevskii]
MEKPLNRVQNQKPMGVLTLTAPRNGKVIVLQHDFRNNGRYCMPRMDNLSAPMEIQLKSGHQPGTSHTSGLLLKENTEKLLFKKRSVTKTEILPNGNLAYKHSDAAETKNEYTRRLDKFGLEQYEVEIKQEPDLREVGLQQPVVKLSEQYSNKVFNNETTLEPGCKAESFTRDNEEQDLTSAIVCKTVKCTKKIDHDKKNKLKDPKKSQRNESVDVILVESSVSVETQVDCTCSKLNKQTEMMEQDNQILVIMDKQKSIGNDLVEEQDSKLMLMMDREYSVNNESSCIIVDIEGVPMKNSDQQNAENLDSDQRTPVSPASLDSFVPGDFSVHTDSQLCEHEIPQLEPVNNKTMNTNSCNPVKTEIVPSRDLFCQQSEEDSFRENQAVGHSTFSDQQNTSTIEHTILKGEFSPDQRTPVIKASLNSFVPENFSVRTDGQLCEHEIPQLEPVNNKTMNTNSYNPVKTEIVPSRDLFCQRSDEDSFPDFQAVGHSTFSDQQNTSTREHTLYGEFFLDKRTTVSTASLKSFVPENFSVHKDSQLSRYEAPQLELTNNYTCTTVNTEILPSKDLACHQSDEDSFRSIQAEVYTSFSDQQNASTNVHTVSEHDIPQQEFINNERMNTNSSNTDKTEILPSEDLGNQSSREETFRDNEDKNGVDESSVPVETSSQQNASTDSDGHTILKELLCSSHLAQVSTDDKTIAPMQSSDTKYLMLQCLKCGLCFPSLETLNAHTRTHTELDFVYFCKVCHIGKHIQSHSGYQLAGQELNGKESVNNGEKNTNSCYNVKTKIIGADVGCQHSNKNCFSDEQAMNNSVTAETSDQQNASELYKRIILGRKLSPDQRTPVCTDNFESLWSCDETTTFESVAHMQSHTNNKLVRQELNEEHVNNETISINSRSTVKRLKCQTCKKTFCSQKNLETHWKSYHTKHDKPHKCKYCTHTFKTPKELAVHVKKHSLQGPYGCEYCKYRFFTKTAQFRHMKTHKETSIECKKCGQRFASQHSFTRHMEAHAENEQYKCPYCEYSCKNMTLLKRHLSKHIGKKHTTLKCEQCGKEFLRKSRLDRHMLIHSDVKPFKCKHCEKRYYTVGNLKKHIKMHTGKKTYKCIECGAKFRLKARLISHVKSHSRIVSFQCDHCGQSFSQNSDLVCHMRTHTREKLYKCIVCDHRFITESSLKSHVSALHFSHSSFRHVCKRCGKSYLKKSELKKHVRFHTGKSISKGCITHVCKQCGKIFENKSILSVHMQYHTGVKPFQCKQCEKRFCTIGNLNVHMRIHTSEKQYKCSECGTAFRMKNLLKKHHMADHADVWPFQCDRCEKGFTQSRELSLHKKTHTQKSYDHTLCKKCGKSFSTISCLTRHQQNVHVSERQYKCQQCSRDYKSEMSLREHLQIHTDKKQHQCTVCEKSFRAKQYLIVHQRKHTGERPYKCTICEKDFAALCSFRYHQQTHTGEKPFQCDKCGKLFTNKRSLMAHIRLHDGTKPYQCDQCNEKFRLWKQLKKHEKNHKVSSLFKNMEGQV